MRHQSPTPPDPRIAATFEVQRQAAVRRMAIIDASPREWRDLINDYPMQTVAEIYAMGRSAEHARKQLVFLFGEPVRRRR